MVTLLMADVLSRIHRNLHRWESPQNLDSAATSRSGAANPPSSLLVDVPSSIGPSTGPLPSNSMREGGRRMRQPNEPMFVARLLSSETISSWLLATGPEGAPHYEIGGDLSVMM